MKSTTKASRRVVVPTRPQISIARYLASVATIRETRMGVLLFEARHTQCRRPLWPDNTIPALDAMFICGAPALPGRTYCEECKPRLVSREIKGPRVSIVERRPKSVPSVAVHYKIAAE